MSQLHQRRSNTSSRTSSGTESENDYNNDNNNDNYEEGEEEVDERIDVDDDEDGAETRPAWMRYAPRTGWLPQQQGTGSFETAPPTTTTTIKTNTASIKRSSNRFSPLFNSKGEAFTRPTKSTNALSDAKAGVRGIREKNKDAHRRRRRVHVGEVAELLSMFKVDKSTCSTRPGKK